MQYTTNYNLITVEGTDVVNPLVQMNPNFTDIDTIMKANADASITSATCVKVGTNHAITRSNTDAAVFKFTATGDWITGDTMTVDSTPVTVYTPNGTSPLTGAYVINTDVIASINGTRVVLYTANTQASSIDAIDVVYDNSVSGLSAVTAQGAIDELRSSQNIVYDNTVSGLTANDVQAAIDEVVAAMPSGGATYTKIGEASSGITYAAQLTSLASAFSALTTEQKMTSFLKYANGIYRIDSLDGRFSMASIGGSATIAVLNISDTTFKNVTNNWTINNSSTTVATYPLELWAMV